MPALPDGSSASAPWLKAFVGHLPSDPVLLSVVCSAKHLHTDALLPGVRGSISVISLLDAKRRRFVPLLAPTRGDLEWGTWL